MPEVVAGEGVLHLRHGARNREPEDERNQPGEREVMESDPDPAGDPPAAEPLDARAHRRRNDESEEDERDDELELPERERDEDDAPGHERHDEGLSRGLCQHPRVFWPADESGKPDVVFA